jgi:hypothetical protein
MNTIENIAKSATTSHGASHSPSETSVSLFDSLVLYLSILTLMACLSFLFAAAAHAQSLPGQETAQAPATITTGWWSVESATSSPRFLLSIAGLPSFQAFDTVKTSTAISGTNLSADSTDNYLANLGDAGSLRSGSFLSLVQTRYVEWESSLADTRTPTSVNGAMVYPLFQINYENGTLPVALYNSSLRGSSDTRW